MSASLMFYLITGSCLSQMFLFCSSLVGLSKVFLNSTEAIFLASGELWSLISSKTRVVRNLF